MVTAEYGPFSDTVTGTTFHARPCEHDYPRRSPAMAPKTVFLAFAEQDRLFRNLFITQWSRAGAQVQFVEPPESQACAPQWHQDVQKRIGRSDGVIALIGACTPGSADQLWQLRCAVGEGRPLLGLWLEPDHRLKPLEMGAARCETWTWENVGDFIDALCPAPTTDTVIGAFHGAL
jgi:hypothetical protein